MLCYWLKTQCLIVNKFQLTTPQRLPHYNLTSSSSNSNLTSSTIKRILSSSSIPTLNWMTKLPQLSWLALSPPLCQTVTALLVAISTLTTLLKGIHFISLSFHLCILNNIEIYFVFMCRDPVAVAVLRRRELVMIC